jgi:hypothetical protein
MRVVRKWIHLNSDYIASGEFLGQLKHNQLVMKCSPPWSYNIVKRPSLNAKISSTWYKILLWRYITTVQIVKITPPESIAGLSELRPTFLFTLLQVYLGRLRNNLSVYATANLLRIIQSSFVTRVKILSTPDKHKTVNNMVYLWLLLTYC